MKRAVVLLWIAIPLAFVAGLLVAPKMAKPTPRAALAATKPNATVGLPRQASIPAPTQPSAPDAVRYRVDDPVPMGDQAAAAQQLVDYRCQSQAECPYQDNLASSEAEAEWLRKRGYPSPRQETALKAMPLSELEQRAKNGDLAAQAVLGSREIAAGHTNQGMVLLHEASVKGSVYALHQFAEAYATDPRMKDISASMALYRLAYLQGDWKAPMSLYRQFPQVGIVELEMADKEALNLYTKLMARRVKNRLPIEFGIRPFPK